MLFRSHLININSGVVQRGLLRISRHLFLLLLLKAVFSFWFFFLNLVLAVLGLHCCTDFLLVLVTRGHSFLVVHNLLIVAASLVAEHGLHSSQASLLHRQQSSCGTWAQDQTHVSWTRDQTHVSCISRWILYHWATREALPLSFRNSKGFRNRMKTKYTFVL